MGSGRRASRSSPQKHAAEAGKARPDMPVAAGTPPLKEATRAAAPEAHPLVPLPSEAEVIVAITSLYDDELKPYGRILRKRLAELAEASGDGSPAIEIDGSRLRTMCEACPNLHVDSEEGGEWSCLLLNRADCFVDVYDTKDTYPDALWTAAAEYFASLDVQASGADGASDLALPGGRYSSAQALAARKLPFLEGRSLGQVCHITQLAISQRKMLGYYNGAIVPYSRSTSMLKRRCAEEQRPLSEKTNKSSSSGGEEAGKAAPLAIAEWDQARQHLREILEAALQKGAEQVPLSNVKRIFRSSYHLELSETALGHAKLSDLLQDARFGDICSVQLQERGYSVLPAAGLRESAATAAATVATATAAPGSPPAAEPPAIAAPAPPQEPLQPRPAGMLPAEAERVRFCLGEPLCMEDALEPSEPPAFPVMTPSPSPQYPHYPAPIAPPAVDASFGAILEQFAPLPWAGGELPAAFGLMAPPSALGFTAPQPERPLAAPVQPPRVQFCPGEPLNLDEAEPLGLVGDGDDAAAWASPAFPAWTPSPMYQQQRACTRLPLARAGLLVPPEEAPPTRVVRIAGLV